MRVPSVCAVLAIGTFVLSDATVAGAGAPPVPSGPGGKAAHVTWSLTVEPKEIPPGGSGAIVAHYELAEGWHLYAPNHSSPSDLGLPTTISWEQAEIERAGPLEFPKPVEKRDESTLGELHRFLEGKGQIRQPFRIRPQARPGRLEIPARVGYMTCSDTSCDPPAVYQATLEVNVSGSAAAEPSKELSARAEPQAAGGAASPGSFVEEAGLLVLILAMVGGGLLALAMPCTYPMIPITLSYFAKQAEKRGGKVLPLALAYGAGIVLVYDAIGWAFARSIGPFAAHPLVNLIFGLAFLVFAVSLFGLFEIRLPSALQRLAGKASAAASRWMSGSAKMGSSVPGAGQPVGTAAVGRAGNVDVLAYIGVFLLGTTVVITSFTCTAPILGSLLAFAVQGGSMARVTIGMTAFGTTIAVPFVLLSLFPARVAKLPKAGEWMHTLKVSLGFVLLAASLKFLSNAEHAKGLSILPRELFFMFWVAIFFVWGLYLLGAVRLRAESSQGIGPTRMLFGLGAEILSGYFFLGVLGFRLDLVTEAIAPPYSAERAETTGGSGSDGTQLDRGRLVVEDDLEAGLTRAKAAGKRALLNFTGVACVNCRAMERVVFPRREIAERLKNYVEVRLHVDKADNAEARGRSSKFKEYQLRLGGSYGIPMYVVVDPDAPEVPIAVFSGADLPRGARFLGFLEANAK